MNSSLLSSRSPSRIFLIMSGLLVWSFLLTAAPAMAQATISGGSGGGGGSTDEINLIIRDTPANLMKIGYILKSIDTPPRQVLIQAHIFTIKLNDQEAMGVDWETFMTEIGRKEPLIKFTPPSGKTGGTVLQFGNLTTEHFKLVLNAMKEMSNSRSISNPKVTTISGREANIKFETRTSYRVSLSTVATGGTVQTAGEPKFIDFPTGLTVTPTVYGNNTIRMKVTPVITTPGDKVEGVPGTETQTATTEVLVNDNETMMLGGLIREERSQENSSMPFADKVPGFLQKMFRSNNRSVTRSELVIFITPRIMDVDRDVAGNRHLVTDGQYDAKGFFTGSDRIFEEKGKGKGKAQKEERQ